MLIDWETGILTTLQSILARQRMVVHGERG
jgi:hypothetical protein